MVSTWSLSSQCGRPEVDRPKLLHGRAQPAWSLEILTSLVTPGWAQESSGSVAPQDQSEDSCPSMSKFSWVCCKTQKSTQKEECVFHKIHFIHVKHCLLFCFFLYFLKWKSPFSYEITVIINGRLYMLFILCSLLGKLISGPGLTFEISLILEIKCGGHCFKVCERDETSGISHYTNEAAMFIPEERKLLSYLEGLEIWGISPRFTFWILILSLLFNRDSTGLKEKLSSLVLKIQKFLKT